MQHELIYRRWNELTATVNSAVSEKYIAALLKSWNEPQRHYHNLSHLVKLLELSAEYRSHLQSPETVDFAIFYHDAVYKPERSNNEEKSALRAETEMAEMEISPAIISEVAVYIRATSAHGNPPSDNNDLNFFLDFDLSVLGAEPAVYDLYAFQVREEFSIYPDQLYKPGRKKVLQSLSEKPVYRTQIFSTRFEEAARANLLREIGAL
ncbi:MAG: HD domain-containing protein [Bacteroidia bacterium]